MCNGPCDKIWKLFSGTGAYGEVKLAVNTNDEAVAVKLIDLSRSPDVEKNIR